MSGLALGHAQLALARGGTGVGQADAPRATGAPEAIGAADRGSRPPLRICAEPDKMPMSQEATRSGFEIEVAEALAKELGRKLEVRWIPQRDQSFFRMTVGSGACDAIMGVPVGFGRLLTTRPWYRTGFVLVGREDRGPLPRSLADPKLRKLRIGVPETGDGETPPALALTRRNLAANLWPYSILAPEALIDAVKEKRVDLAAIWGPYGGWYAGKEGSGLALAPIPDRDGAIPLAYDIAIGVKKGNTALKDELDRAIDRRKGEIAAILARWRIPVRPL